MKVYVIEKGEYSDRHVIGVTLDEEKAKYVVETSNEKARNSWVLGSGDYDYTEFEMDKFDELYNLYKNDYKMFQVIKDLENKKITISEKDINDNLDDVGVVRKSYYENYLYVYVLANTTEKALKIASDKFAEYEYDKIFNNIEGFEI